MTAPATTGPLRIGVIGLGRSGWNLHCAGLSDLPDLYHLAAASDPLPERRDEAAARFGVRTYADPDELIADDDLEVVVVATPSHTHLPIARAALAAGKHVVVEKPMAATPTEVDELIAAAAAAGRTVTAFQNQRLEPSFLMIRDIVKQGRIGELVLMRRTIHRFGRRADWQTLRSHGGGELPNTALHFLDQMLTVLDDGEVELLADLRHLQSAGDAEDHVKIVVRPRSGPLIDLETSYSVASPQDSWFVVGTAGTIVGSATELTVRWTDRDSLPPLEANPQAAPGRSFGSTEELTWSEEIVTVDTANATTAQQYYRLLFESLRHGAPLFVTPQSVRRVTDLLERARAQSSIA